MNTRFDTEARVAVTQAVDLARELGHREVGPDHLLLGLLANPRGRAYAALTDHGLTLDAAREIVASRHEDPQVPTDVTGEAGEDAAHGGYDEDRDALRALGIDLDRVREAVRQNLGQDLAADWGDRPDDRRRGRGRRRGRHHQRRHHGEHGQQSEPSEGREQHGVRGRGRRGPRSRRDGGPAFSRSLRAVLRDVRRSVLRDRLEQEDRAGAHAVPGMTGARLLVALIRCDDPTVQAVLATAHGAEGLRAQAEAGVHPAGA